jgi:predicted DsbA family dithiol-disulfide isomerase
VSRSIRLGAAAAGMGVACAIGIAIGAQVPRQPDDAEFGRKVRAYILTHPEILAEAAARMRIGPLREAIETPFASAWAGNPKGDVTVVMFSDYNCPYCRATVPEIERLLAQDSGIRVVWREMPVLGPDSETAAAAALAAARFGKYRAFHDALFTGGHPDSRGIAAAARAVGLDPGKLSAEAKAPEVQAEISTNLALARRMEIAATPYFVIGNRIYEGAIGFDALEAAVAEVRGKG